MEVFVLGGGGSKTDAVRKKGVHTNSSAKSWGHRDSSRVGSVL